MRAKKILLLIILFTTTSALLVLNGSGQSPLTYSNKIECGNNVCEASTLNLKIGEEKSIEINGKAHTFRLIKIEKEETPYLTYNVYLSVDNSPTMLADEAKEKTGINFNCCGFIGDASGVKIEEGAQINFGENEICNVPDCAFRVESGVYKKWNLVPYYFIANEKTLKKGSCKLQDFVVVYAYNPISKDYTKLYEIGAAKNLETSASDFQRGFETARILAGTPFNSVWIYSSNECKLAAEIPVQFENMLATLRLIAQGSGMTFASGWNFFIGGKDMQGKSFDEIEGSCNIEKAYKFDASSQSWKQLDKAPGPADNFIIKVTDKCMFGGEEIGLPPMPT